MIVRSGSGGGGGGGYNIPGPEESIAETTATRDDARLRTSANAMRA